METYSLYKGRIQVDYDPAKHIYYVEDSPVNGITDALKIINKPFLLPWAVKLAADKFMEGLENMKVIMPDGTSVENLLLPQVVDELELKKLYDESKAAYRYKSTDAADIGTMGHDWIERWYRGENPKTPANEQLRNIVNAFLKFAESHTIEPLYSERLLYDAEFRYAGRVDMICRIDGKLAILDWKTSKDIYPEYFLQLGGYSKAYSLEELGNFIDKPNEYPEPVQLHVVVQCSKLGEMNVAMSEEIQRHEDGFVQALQLTRTMRLIEGEMKANKKAKREAAKLLKKAAK